MPNSETHHRKLLVISEIGLGDALTLIPALETLKQKRPGLQIDMLAPGLYPLRDAYKSIFNILDHEPISQMDRKQRFQWLKNQLYQWVWNTENEKSHWRRIFEVVNHPRWISSPPHKKWPKRSVLKLRQQQLKKLFPEVDSFTKPLLELSLNQAQERQQFLSQFPMGEKLIAIQPGAKDPTKVWPTEKYIQLIHVLLQQSDISVLLFLTSEEKKQFPESALPNSNKLLVITEPLNQLIPKLAACNLFIGNDSGFYHLSFALHLPVIGFFRSRRNMKIWAYHSERAKAMCVHLPHQIRHHWHRLISVKSVVKAANRFLKQK